MTLFCFLGDASFTNAYLRGGSSSFFCRLGCAASELSMHPYGAEWVTVPPSGGFSVFYHNGSILKDRTLEHMTEFEKRKYLSFHSW